MVSAGDRPASLAWPKLVGRLRVFREHKCEGADISQHDKPCNRRPPYGNTFLLPDA
jgi:hypothetical protein